MGAKCTEPLRNDQTWYNSTIMGTLYSLSEQWMSRTVDKLENIDHRYKIFMYDFSDLRANVPELVGKNQI